MTADIKLNAAMNNNLLALQNTSKLMDMTQERLSTGLKVNSAIDNPSAYFTAQSLNQRASDLSSLLDSVGQAVQTLKAADEGIESITTFVQQAKAVAQQARDSQDVETRVAAEKQFNAILKEIDALAKDSGYRGTNLLTSQDLTVVFNEKFAESKNTYEIKGVDATASGLGLNEATTWSTATVDETGFTNQKPADFTDTEPTEPTAPVNQVNGNSKYEYNGTEYDTFTEAEDAYDTDLETYNTDLATYNTNLATYNKELAAYNSEYDTALLKAGNDEIEKSIGEVEAAIANLRTFASDFGNSYSIVQTREVFTENLINVLTEGADKLTLADMNEESANMLALQTRQQLGINALSLASQANQAVLKLF